MSIRERIKGLIRRKCVDQAIKLMESQVFEFIKNADITKPTIALLEPYTCHGEVYPSYIKYFLDLGYDVHLLVQEQHLKFNSLENCNFPPDKFKMFSFRNFPDMQEFYEFLLNYEYLFFMTLFTSGGFCYVSQFKENFLQKYNKDNIYGISHEIISSKLPTGLEKDEVMERHMLDNDKIFVLRPDIKHKSKELPFASSIYFGDIRITPKNKKIRFVSIGGIWKKGLRNFDKLFNAIRKLHENNFRDFEIVFVCIDKVLFESYLTPEIASYVTLIDRVPYKDLYNCVEDGDFILFNIDKEATVDYEKYLHYGITGNYSISIGFETPGLIYEELALAYDLDNTKAIHYTDDLYDAMKQAIEMPQIRYSEMQLNIKKFKEKLMERSAENLQNAFHKQPINVDR